MSAQDTTSSRVVLTMPSTYTLTAVEWPEVTSGDDLVALTGDGADLRDGDIAVLTSKVVSKAEGRLVHGERTEAIAAETRRVVARRGSSVIAETRLGLVMAAAGVDASNTPAGTALLLPHDPDESARRLRQDVYATSGRNVGVVITDTAGRAWRMGQTDLAVGCAGLPALHDLDGTLDTHGNRLLVTAAAVADELAAAADLVKGKTTGRPLAIARGFAGFVLPPGEHGPGAASLVRPAADDLFGLGAREAVAAATLRDDPDALDHFPVRTATETAPFRRLLDGWLHDLPAERRRHVQVALTPDDCPSSPDSATWVLRIAVRKDAEPGLLIATGRLVERAETLAAGWRLSAHAHDLPAPNLGWRSVAQICWQDH
ncbi:MAG: coenzyme F420-0:L-glutamate ligase [Nocardioidaceae bacterium]